MKVKEHLWVEEDDNMALCPPSKPKFEGVSEGTKVAICDMVADLGMQDGMYGLKHQVYIRFQVPSERVKWTDESGKEHEGAKVIGKSYGFTLTPNSTLRKHLEAWRGKAFADSELMDQSGNPIFDISKVAGQACQLAVVKNENGNGTISTIIGLPQGFPKPALDNEVVVYDADNPGNLSKLPEWIQKMIGEAGQVSNASAEHANQTLPVDTAQPPVADFDDDIPF
jgi:hypothetical protein